MHQSNSGQANGTSGSPQTTLQQQALKQKAAENEAKIKTAHTNGLIRKSGIQQSEPEKTVPPLKNKRRC